MIMLLFYLKLIVAAICGQIIALIVKSFAMEKKAKMANVEPTPFLQFIKEDRKSIYGTTATLVLFLLFVGEGTKQDALIVKDHSFTWWIFEFSVKTILNIIFIAITATIGYVGMDIALKFFSFTNNKINTAISQAPPVTDTTNQ